MKRYLFMLLIPLVLLSGCSSDTFKHEDIAYKTTIYHTGGISNQVDYYVITKDGKMHGVTIWTWQTLSEIPIK